MYTVRIYGYDPQAGPDALLEEQDFADPIAALECISDTPPCKRAELWATI